MSGSREEEEDRNWGARDRLNIEGNRVGREWGSESTASAVRGR